VHAETVLEDWSRVNEWIEFEMRLNEVLPRYNDPVICAYDANLLNGAIAVDILRTHPVAIIGGLLHENPFFVPRRSFSIGPRNTVAGRPSHTEDDAVMAYDRSRISE
jgi:MEDS: MEthanogen/methylotroph, DcmR Sensory domain